MEALASSLKGLANYPTTQGIPALREAIAAWNRRRYGLELNPETEILPVNGSREALFSFAQTVIDPGRGHVPLVVSPNPFYQIYEGAAYLAGAEPRFLNNLPENDSPSTYASLTEEEWARVQLFYVCSPGNPTGKVLSLDDWKTLFALSDRYGFTIASDECYSEIYFDEAAPPLGGSRQRACWVAAMSDWSPSPASPSAPTFPACAPASSPATLPSCKKFLLYRTYHGCAMAPPVQLASRCLERRGACPRQPQPVREKFAACTPLIGRSPRHRACPMPVSTCGPGRRSPTPSSPAAARTL
jgi:N-succinyldiaminopimelate aminotransferase